MMKKNREQDMQRNTFDIYADILSALNNGIHKPTRLTQVTNISTEMKNKAIKKFIEKGLIIGKQIDTKHIEYYITEKGYLAYTNYKNLKDMLM